PASDIYALGVVSYQMLAARLPYEAESLTALALKQQREAPPLLDQLNADVPAEIALVVDRALSLDPGARYASAEAYAKALDDGLAGIGPSEDDSTRVVHPVTGATAIVPRQQIEDIQRDFDDTADHTLMQPAVRRSPREAAARPVSPAGGWVQNSAAAPPQRRGAAGRVLRVLLIAAVLAAVVGGAIYYVAGQQVAPRLNDVAGDTVNDVSNKLDELIRNNVK
ncbi:MAG: hypothetical protein WC558_12395, partial [Patulibacter sp.]